MNHFIRRFTDTENKRFLVVVVVVIVFEFFSVGVPVLSC